ncbi:hypothetical protein TWF970_004405 [Orbilia oligospora]|uniref:Uncharacterized protein n=1 Tax=Orbilia oligospora TaxID=2813651 RepID=A0A7C8VE42_ORBOL|nr:hypothetical protein TWF970_004405 [Orbilia oligospora]
MRLAIVFITLVYALVVGAMQVEYGCRRDNCLRAVIAKAFPNRQGAADCSSFLLTTVTPAAKTVTVTEKTTTTIFATKRVGYRDIEARQVTVVPSNIPAYAAACSGRVRYSSACSCIGVKPSVTTAPTPTKTVTVTRTFTKHCTVQFWARFLKEWLLLGNGPGLDL